MTACCETAPARPDRSTPQTPPHNALILSLRTAASSGQSTVDWLIAVLMRAAADANKAAKLAQCPVERAQNYGVKGDAISRLFVLGGASLDGVRPWHST